MIYGLFLFFDSQQCATNQPIKSLLYKAAYGSGTAGRGSQLFTCPIKIQQKSSATIAVNASIFAEFKH
jgi:hypothetical protein